jgi:hypothetical protein
MMIKLVLMIAAAGLMVVGLPVLLVLTLIGLKRDKGSKRRGGGGGVSSFVGAALLDLDRVVRPSIEHTIETEHQVFKREDDQDGD